MVKCTVTSGHRVGFLILYISELLMVTMLSPPLPAPQYDHKRISKLAERLIQKIMKSLPDVVMNGDPEHHYPGMVVPILSSPGRALDSEPPLTVVLSFRLYQPLLCVCGRGESVDGT